MLGSVVSGVHAAGMNAAMGPVIAGVTEIPADCGICDQGNMAMTAGACIVMCHGLQAALSEPGTPDDVLAESVARAPGLRTTGSVQAPDPFPPKLTILG